MDKMFVSPNIHIWEGQRGSSWRQGLRVLVVEGSS